MVSSYPRARVISKVAHPAVKAAIRDRLCFPEPDTPTRSMFPWSKMMVLSTRVRCSRASSKKTRFIFLNFELYASSCSVKRALRLSKDSMSW